MGLDCAYAGCKMGSVVAKKSSPAVVQAGSSPVEEAISEHLSETTAQSDRLPVQPLSPPSRTHGIFSNKEDVNSPSPVSLTPLDAGSISINSTSSDGRGQTTRGETVTRVLRSLEEGFGVNFERGEELLNHVRQVHCGPGKTLLASGQNAVGVYIVEEGALDVFSPQEDAVLCRLQPGDFCGELSSFFHIPCTATIRGQSGLR